MRKIELQRSFVILAKLFEEKIVAVADYLLIRYIGFDPHIRQRIFSTYLRALRNEIKRRHRTKRIIQVREKHPPIFASYLLDISLSGQHRAVISGDLSEEYASDILPKYGLRRAQLWFWVQTVRTIATQNPVCRWMLVYGITRLGEWFVRQINL